MPDFASLKLKPFNLSAADLDWIRTTLAKLCGREGAAVGANWAFAPIIDIDYNFRNPITNRPRPVSWSRILSPASKLPIVPA